ncbi:MAG: bacillithiol biosynthesis deacetylase BshB1 [Acidobacteria bacterium]|jgi:bacillithiol biosynthesis deacetylase BshB1|nr:bacillithiol biosynthesis deacetylase BshB1 [Acidobacteriota bacterium]MDP7337800.1 bacillithiol biosynthesis deacetylase BshB1 [Vicinamibacterales bacterium]MDP7477874.1 bacillithiol biosynthesis deacetylase BshB1 [Vicinamibacterales bacterium]MDP7690401.1 bacillithiol biosynthesis deacetylase BshB1 [Vicinamibacterales bacterium]HJN44666.1 bacillithiol biosynthesis deacetylase BshB1 [Vicinamibacterales bacterium]
MTVDLLGFGPHPDDIEIGAGGTIAKQVRQGHQVGLCDLTRGELGSNGTVDDRLVEATAAANVLGVAWRENLEWPDGEIGGADRVRSAAELVRRCRPATVLIPHWADRHPDHVAASQALTAAVFKSGLRRYDAAGDAWRPDWICYYFINDAVSPSFVVDVSDDCDAKRRALDSHGSQFAPDAEGAVSTRLTTPRFRRMIEARDEGFGVSAGVAFAEGFVVREPIVRSDVMK